MYVANGAEFINKGKVELNNTDVDFSELGDEGATFVVAKDGTYEANSFKGDVFLVDKI